MFFTYCITFNQQLPGPPALQVFWTLFFFFFLLQWEQWDAEKSFRKGAGQISSNCLVIGEWFPFPTISLAGGEEGRCGLAGIASSRPDVPGAGGEAVPCTQACDLPHTCAHFSPLIDDLVLTWSDLAPWPVLWAQLLAGGPAFPLWFTGGYWRWCTRVFRGAQRT